MATPPVIIVPTGTTASVFDAVALLSQPNQQAIIRPNDPPPGIGGWVMDVVGDEEVNLSSNITDHFAEDNTTLQDNIALPPVEVEVRGLVAELLQTPNAAGAVDSSHVGGDPGLPEIVEQGPEFTAQATQDMAIAALANEATLAAITGPGSLAQYQQSISPQQPGQTRQSNAFAYFVQLWLGRQLFTVETPWGFFNNMAMKSLSGKQGKESRTQTEFSITFKQIRFAGNVTVTLGKILGRAHDYISASAPVNNTVGNGPTLDFVTTHSKLSAAAP